MTDIANYCIYVLMIHLPKKKAILLTVSVIVLGALGGTVLMATQSKLTGADTSPVVTELSNHEARLKNAENNIKDLQAKTNTPDSASNVTVPQSAVATDSDVTSTGTSVSTPVTPVDNPVVVTAFREVVLDADNSDCEYTYSDGTTYQFHWKTTNPKGSWITDGQGQNGHWEKSIATNGYCSDKALGLPKAS